MSLVSKRQGRTLGMKRRHGECRNRIVFYYRRGRIQEQ